MPRWALNRERCAARSTGFSPWDHVLPRVGIVGLHGGATRDEEFGPLGIVRLTAWASHVEAPGHDRASGRVASGQKPRLPSLIQVYWLLCQYSSCRYVSSEKEAVAFRVWNSILGIIIYTPLCSQSSCSELALWRV
jgi:hypothetical protein